MNQTVGLLTYSNLSPSEITASTRILYTPSNFAKENLWYIQEIGKLRSLKGHLSKKDTLNSFLYLLVLSGSGSFFYAGNTYHLTAGQQLFIDCAIPYAHESNDKDPWELMWVHFNGIGVKGFYQYYCTQNDGILSSCIDTIAVTHSIEELMSYAQKKSNDYELLISNELNSLITKIIISDRLENITTISDNKLMDIKEYIDKNYTSKITLEELSELFYISKYHMSREFKRLFGTSIINYQIDCRITHAKELLRFSNLRIEEIAEQCGISDNSYFNKVFQKTEGMSAREFRKKWKST